MVEGTLAGQKDTYDCPISLRLFGTSDPIQRADLRRRMKADHLPVEALEQREEGAKRRKVEELNRMQAAKKAQAFKALAAQGGRKGGQAAEPRSSQSQFAGSSSQGDDGMPVQSLEEIMVESQRLDPRHLGGTMEKFGMGEEFLSQMPMAALPERLATTLLSYQRQSLAWLVEKENPKLPPPKSTEVVQLWKRSSRDPKVFTNIATNFSLKDQLPAIAKGGILAVSFRRLMEG